ncbi:hypothetical protein AB0L71_01715 [Streptomyces sp. NPDC052052]|uniref:hypothetical protein n=1 Tax=Streptomyces sp. NPDC052052 TaxID=3154756 RepID=UPI003445077E
MAAGSVVDGFADAGFHALFETRYVELALLFGMFTVEPDSDDDVATFGDPD